MFTWSKPVTNRYGMPVRTSKCGRARIVKLNGSEQTYNEYIPLLDGEFLPRYYALKQAKEALECAEAGQPLPKAKKPKFAIEYDVVEETDEQAEARWKRTTDWFKNRRGQGAPVTFVESPHKILGVSPDSSFSDIKKAYRKLQLKAHPDHGGDATRWNEIREAFEKLKKLEESTIEV